MFRVMLKLSYLKSCTTDTCITSAEVLMTVCFSDVYEKLIRR